MKKTKLLLLIATLLAVATVFCSCGTTVSSVNKFLNKDFDPKSDVYNDASTVSELVGYSIVKSNEEFVIFRSIYLTNVTYKVFSMNASKVIATFADSESVFAFKLFDYVPVVIVAKATKTDDIEGTLGEDLGDMLDGIEATIDELADVTYTAYDADGNIIKTTDYKPEAPYLINFDTCIFDYAAYSVSTNGELTKEIDIPEYILVDSIDHVNDDYYYVINGTSISVYDHAFNTISHWVAPSYLSNIILPHIMNNGNILVQYTYEVDEDQKKYDLSDFGGEYTAKLNLVSLIIDAKNGSAKEIELDYIVIDCYTNSNLNRYHNYLGEVSPFNDDFENIAIIAPIVDKKIDDSDASLDIVFMNNKGKAQDSLKIVDNQRASLSAISKIGDDLYIADTLTGSALINAKGKVQQTMNTSLTVCGEYFVGDRAIYNLDLESVYSLTDNKAEVLACIDNTVFVKATNDNGYTILAFRDGDYTTVYTYVKESNSTLFFNIIEGVGYVIVNSATKDHTYYNSEGKTLLTTAYELEVEVTSNSNDIVILKGIDGEKTNYHVISKIDATN